MDTQYANRAPAQGDDNRRQTGRPARTIRWINRAITAGLLAAATIMGVQFGMDAPTVSPVSPPAIAQQAALLAGGTDVAQALPVQYEGDHTREENDHDE